jgi:hypothetical protein
MTEPLRPLGAAGRAAWDADAEQVDDTARLLTYCETLDEREILRRRVLRNEGTPGDRRALREIEARLEDLADAVARDRSWFAYEGV